jgi:hypothetical protein
MKRQEAQTARRRHAHRRAGSAAERRRKRRRRRRRRREGGSEAKEIKEEGSTKRKSLGKSGRRLLQMASRPLLLMLFQYKSIFLSRLLHVSTCVGLQFDGGSALIHVLTEAWLQYTSLCF